jgi:hypothetical protein
MSRNQVNHTLAAQTHVDPIIVSGGSVSVDVPDTFSDQGPSGKYKHFKNNNSDLLCVQVFDRNGVPLLTYNVPDSKCEVKIWYSE